MRALVQRVREGSVTIDGNLHTSIGHGMVVLLGIRNGDTVEAATYLAEKCAALRIFEDENGKMNLSLRDVGGSALVVSQFTLYADTQRGNRPSFTDAAPLQEAEALYESFVLHLRQLIGDDRVKCGVFRAMMDVGIVNQGPVTILLESR
jgi:D-tyrosyl-tRNA(Tyr) deacylase